MLKVRSATFKGADDAIGLDDAFGHWLAGFIDGEGCFTIHRVVQRSGSPTYGCHFALALRADDTEILKQLQEMTGLGRVRWRPAYAYEKHPQAVWLITNKSGAAGLARILDRYPLRAKKARDFAIWREALDDWLTVRSPGVQHDWTRMATLKEELQAGRRY